MSEKIIGIGSHHPLDIFGVNDQNLDRIRKAFPKLKLISRDDTIKAMGEESELLLFEDKFNLLLLHLEKFGKLALSDIEQILDPAWVPEEETELHHSGVLVHGKNGMLIRARTVNQRNLVKSVEENDLVFAIGPAGTGKTYTAVALAVRALKNKEIQRIILTRPAVEAGENLGFLPGDLKEKLDPYLQPLYDALHDMLPYKKLETWIEDGTVQIAPLAFMRGRTLENAFVILDEAQNATISQIKMFLTRMGVSSKFIMTGDTTQIDLPRKNDSGLLMAMRILANIEGISIIKFDERDIVRHKLVKRIVRAYEKEENEIDKLKNSNIK